MLLCLRACLLVAMYRKSQSRQSSRLNAANATVRAKLHTELITRLSKWGSMLERMTARFVEDQERLRTRTKVGQRTTVAANVQRLCHLSDQTVESLMVGQILETEAGRNWTRTVFGVGMVGETNTQDHQAPA